MTNPEFSDTFDVLLNSYNTQANFGEEASHREIALDEYEKSVLLTQAQDIIVKSYFEARTNPTAEGFDDSERRQIDFSSLITVETLSQAHIPVEVNVKKADESSIGVLQIEKAAGVPYDKTWKLRIYLKYDAVETLPPIETIVNEFTSTITVNLSGVSGVGSISQLVDTLNSSVTDLPSYFKFSVKSSTANTLVEEDYIAAIGGDPLIEVTEMNDYEPFDKNGKIFNIAELSKPLLFMLNERLIVDNKSYVVVPLNYKEYDRRDSKPYSQPLKKQCWRLFQNDTIDTLSEIIPIWDAVTSNSTIAYKLRYVRRPRPIVLVNLPDGLKIDDEPNESPCELNKILHMDILNKAVELAIATRGGGSAVQQQNNRREE